MRGNSGTLPATPVETITFLFGLGKVQTKQSRRRFLNSLFQNGNILLTLHLLYICSIRYLLVIIIENLLIKNFISSPLTANHWIIGPFLIGTAAQVC